VVYKKSCSQQIIVVFLTVPLSHLTSCTPTKSNLYFVDSLETAVNDPDQYKLLTFHVLVNVMYIFHCLVCTNGSAQDRGKIISFVKWPVFTVRSFQHLAQLPSWRTVPCWLSGLLIQNFRCYPPYCRPFFFPQTEYAPGCGDREPHSFIHFHSVDPYRVKSTLRI